MNIFVINLARSPERLAHMTATLGAMGLAFERVEAVDGRSLSRSERTTFEEAHRGPLPWTAAEIGCFLSHLETWRRAARSSSRWSLIFEDDVKLSPSLPAFLDDLERGDVPANALVKIETMGSRVVISKQALYRIGDTFLHRLRSAHMGAAGYIVSNSIARSLAAFHYRINEPVDAIWMPWIARPLGATLLQATPALVVQDFLHASGERIGLPSTIAVDRQNRQPPFQPSRWLWSARKLPYRILGLGKRAPVPFWR